MSELEKYVNDYTNEGPYNDWIHGEFGRKTDEIPFLKEHRDYVERERLGFGERPFHYMWYLLLEDLGERCSKPELLEIGVYKGQVISLWALLSKELDIQTSISCISPLNGNLPASPLFNNRVVNKVRRYLSPGFRKDCENGNLYVQEDFERAIRGLFDRFGLDLGKVNILRGSSSDPRVLEKVGGSQFDLVYVDGDHSFEAVTADIMNYAPLVKPQGYLVMDDASYYLPGTAFWKGHKDVSRACKIIEQYGLANILNIGHNRVYQKH